VRPGFPPILVVGLVVGAVGFLDPVTIAGQDQRPTFRASVERVTLAVTVRTSRGRQVTDLQASDFEVLDQGRRREITEFRTDPAPVSLGFLVDFSGSMDVAARRDVARESVRHLLAWLTPGVDHAGLFVFDKQFRELQPLAPAPGDILAQFDRIDRPFGVTSLFDAIAATGQRLATHGGSRRAVVAFTDGADNASTLTPGEVSGLASSIDVPVYVVITVSPFDRSGRGTINDARINDMLAGSLGNLARWTGGEIYAGVGPAHLSQAAQQIVTDLRQQYLIAFEPGSEPGWHPLEVRVSDENLVVRARSGYIVRDETDER
jgi:Ca-activated chloride channel family protein